MAKNISLWTGYDEDFCFIPPHGMEALAYEYTIEKVEE